MYGATSRGSLSNILITAKTCSLSVEELKSVVGCVWEEENEVLMPVCFVDVVGTIALINQLL